jgi:hypothetical protein
MSQAHFLTGSGVRLADTVGTDETAGEWEDPEREARGLRARNFEFELYVHK